jgi:hypothetical protein
MSLLLPPSALRATPPVNGGRKTLDEGLSR